MSLAPETLIDIDRLISRSDDDFFRRHREECGGKSLNDFFDEVTAASFSDCNRLHETLRRLNQAVSCIADSNPQEAPKFCVCMQVTLEYILQVEREYSLYRSWMQTDQTECLSRSAYNELLATGAEFEEASALALDMKKFGQVNKREGHPTGDKCIEEISSILNATLFGPKRTFRQLACYHYGGDEWVIFVFHSCDPSALNDLAQRISDALKEFNVEAKFGRGYCDSQRTLADAAEDAFKELRDGE